MIEQVYFLTFEFENGRHRYRTINVPNLKHALYRAQVAYNATEHQIVAVYLYDAYCPVCSPDVGTPINFQDHIDCDCDLEPATQYDYIAKFDGEKEKVRDLP